MTQIYGAFNRTASGLSPSIAAASMAGAVRACEPDVEHSWCNSRVAMGIQLQWNTPESKYERQPRCATTLEGSVVLLADARIDNREFLASELGVPVRKLIHMPDSELLLLGYLRWGKNLPQQLLGDFVLVIWDDRSGELFCARDHLGIKMLYFYLGQEVFLFASDIRGLRCHPMVPSGIDIETAAIYLNEGEPFHPQRTFLSSIKKLAAAHSITVGATEWHRSVYWRADDCQRLKNLSPEESSYQLRQLLEDSVRCRMRTAYPVASHLSGGLDSSTITALAAGCPGGGSMTTYNWVAAPGKEDDPGYYEWGDGRLVAESLGLPHDHVDLTEDRLAGLLLNHDLADGDSTDLWYEYLVRERAVSQGARTMLSGWGGDELISAHGGGAVVEMLWRGHPLAAFREMSLSVKSAPVPARRLLGLVYRTAVKPFLPWDRGIPMSNYIYTACAYPSFQEFCQRRRVNPVFLSRFSMRNSMLALLNFGFIQNRVESWAVTGNRMGLEYRYPLLDRRIVEFALGLSPIHFLKGGLGRYVFREAIKGLIPDSVRLASKADDYQRVTRYMALYSSVFSRPEVISALSGERCLASEYVDLRLLSEQCMLLDQPHRELEELIDIVTLVEKSYLLARMNVLE